MTPKQKAKALVNSFDDIIESFEETSVQAAIKCVDEIINTCPKRIENDGSVSDEYDYWDQVARELQNML